MRISLFIIALFFLGDPVHAQDGAKGNDGDGVVANKLNRWLGNDARDLRQDRIEKRLDKVEKDVGKLERGQKDIEDAVRKRFDQGE